MTQVQIQMEKRACKNCGRTYKVMSTSVQSVCPTACDRLGMPGLGAHLKVLSESESNKEIVSVSVTKPTKPTDPKNYYSANVGAWPIRKNPEKPQENITTTTRRNEMLSEPSGLETIESAKMPTNEVTTTPVQMVPSSKTNVDKSENPIGSYEAQSAYFQKELSESTSVLNESMRLLHDRTKSLLQKPENEMQSTPLYNFEEARQNMNLIAKLIQTKINFIKVLK